MLGSCGTALPQSFDRDSGPVPTTTAHLPAGRPGLLRRPRTTRPGSPRPGRPAPPSEPQALPAPALHLAPDPSVATVPPASPLEAAPSYTAGPASLPAGSGTATPRPLLSSAPIRAQPAPATPQRVSSSTELLLPGFDAFEASDCEVFGADPAETHASSRTDAPSLPDGCLAPFPPDPPGPASPSPESIGTIHLSRSPSPRPPSPSQDRHPTAWSPSPPPTLAPLRSSLTRAALPYQRARTPARRSLLWPTRAQPAVIPPLSPRSLARRRTGDNL
jgi:hypothetical protein